MRIKETIEWLQPEVTILPQHKRSFTRKKALSALYHMTVQTDLKLMKT